MKFDDFLKVVDKNQKIVQVILDAINSGILILNDYQKIVFANSRAKSLLGLNNDLIGRGFEELFLPDDQQILAKNILKLSERQGEFDGEVLLKKATETTFMAYLSVSFWNINDKKTYIVTINDISRLKRVEKVLKNSEKMVYLGQMLDDISHQIRNPVLAIGGFARRLLKTRLEHPEYVKIIIDEAKRLEMLLDELTEFIQLPKANFAIYNTTSVVDFITEIAKEITQKFNAKLLIKNNIQNEKIVLTDFVLLKRAVEPILINACEAYFEKEGPLEITLSFSILDEKRGGLKISIEDKGIGIRAPIIERIFHPFFTTKTGHLGMGLTFAKRIMEELDGDINLKSSLNKGTKVILELPGDRRRLIRTNLI